MITITLVSGGTIVALPIPSFFRFDKLAHFCVFGLLATSILRSLPPGIKPFHAMLIAFAATSLFGISDELHQSMTPGRTLDLYDWTADTAGALVAAIAYTSWPRYRKVLEWRIVSSKAKISQP